MTLPHELFFAAALAFAGWFMLRLRARRRRAGYIDTFDLHGLLDARLAKRRPALDAAQRGQVLEGLREWFHVCREAGRRHVSMPSQAVDDAWHEFILFTRNYREFCRHGLGRFLHHVPAEAMSRPTQAQEGIRRTWRIACRRAGIDARKPARLPQLFALDGELGLADGFRYSLDCRAGARRGEGGGGSSYCASHIGCSSGCGTGGDSGTGSDSGMGSDSGSGCGSGCGGGGD